MFGDHTQRTFTTSIWQARHRYLAYWAEQPVFRPSEAHRSPTKPLRFRYPETDLTLRGRYSVHVLAAPQAASLATEIPKRSLTACLRFLLASDVSFCGLHRSVATQKLNLFALASGSMAELGATAPLMPHAALSSPCRMPDNAESKSQAHVILGDPRSQG